MAVEGCDQELSSASASKSCMSKRPRSPEGPPSELPADPLQVPNCMKEAEAHFPEELDAQDNLMAVEGCDQELSSASASSEFPSTLSTTAVEVCKEELSSASASNVLPSATSTTSVCAPLHGSRWYPRLQRHLLKNNISIRCRWCGEARNNMRP